MKNKKRWLAPTSVIILAVTLLVTVFAPLMSAADTTYLGQTPYINQLGGVSVNNSQFFNGDVIYQLPDTVRDSDEISLIIEMPGDTLLDSYDKSGTKLSFTEYFATEEAEALREASSLKATEYMEKLDRAGISYAEGESYSTIMNGFEVKITARDFKTVCKTLGDEVKVIVGDKYKTSETTLVENNVDVYDTGIFDSSDFAFDGTGIVVAVLDTGIDYYHTAFSMSNFTASADKWGLTFEEVASLVGGTVAAERVNGLTASDVYINGKIPFAFDYADNDSDVFPINSNHGTHVSGVIAGKDDTITGVAPNAQLVEMKIFSDVQQSALTSWILAALEDCVILGVDVINMSIGTSCGFSRENDKETLSGVYDKIRERGISLVVAASNSFNSTYASDKNGNLGLTSNPDSATVGSPSTYKGTMSVASISGSKTSYILYNGKIVYYVESTNKVSEEKNFLDDLLGKDVTEKDFEYVVIPGAGREADYTGIDVKDKIALVSRGSNTFEEKANTAEKLGAAGIIIYNNVSGEIKMNVGYTKIAVCSISQDDGKMLAEAEKGIIRISRNQNSGPFMSDFSSWGPNPDLEIKPEITAHGGSILSAVPGQDYDRISGTSMATPNISGVTALLRQYVKENFPELRNDPVALNAFVNRLMMSTADIVISKNGLPYSVRKQGAGLANLNNCADTEAYILTYDRDDGSVMDKSKIELGDDPSKTGQYTLKFTIDNFGSRTLSYKIGAYVFTEAVSDTLTSHGETTVAEEAYALEGAKVEIVNVDGGSRGDNGVVSVGAGQKATVSLTITLTEENKKYLNESFKNGMYVEGFVTLTAETENAVDLNVPYLAFYGDWTVAPMFDLDYYATNKDELDDSIDMLDKTLPDAYATRPVGGLSEDYVSYLGSFYYEQKPGSNMISANRDYISLTNQSGGVNSLKYVWAGLLRNAARVEVTITDDATGEVVYETVDYDIRKAYGDGGPIRPANIDINFSALYEDGRNLKNNSKYTVTLKGYLDYEDGGADTNSNNVFTFPLYIDFEAPTVTGCEFYTEYDKSEKKNRLYAKIAVYDNHYTMAGLLGYVGVQDGEYVFSNFDRYLTQVYSKYNSTSYIVYELTDYIDDIKENAFNKNSFTVALYDYALNTATYEISLPDDYMDLYFAEEEVTLSPNQTLDLTPMVYPNSEWAELVEYSSNKNSVARVVNGKLVAVGSGSAKITARAETPSGDVKTATLYVTVLGPEDAGYKRYDKPVLNSFEFLGFTINKAFYFIDSTDRDLGEEGTFMKFPSSSYNLSMYPSEQVTLSWDLDAYFPEITTIEFVSSNSSIAKVDQSGSITALKEGYAQITAKVLLDGKSTYYSKTVTISVKQPYVISGPSLANYFGNGGMVVIPENLAVTEIGQYAFSNYKYVSKNPADITEEMPETMELTYIGNNTITSVVIPEGVESIGPYAFAGLTALQEVVLPSTVTKIDYGAFFGCSALTTVKTRIDGVERTGMPNVKFFNQNAFAGCGLRGTLTFTSAVAIADYAFAYNTSLTGVTLTGETQSVGAYAFAGNTKLETLKVQAEKIKLGQFVFSGCTSLKTADFNTAVVPSGAFYGCRSLESVTLGKDVAHIGEYAFGGTKLSSITVKSGNTALYPVTDAPYLLDNTGTKIILVTPATENLVISESSKIKVLGTGACSGNTNLKSIYAPSITIIDSYAMANCTKLSSVTFGKLTAIGDYAFQSTAVTLHPSFDSLSLIGDYAFANTKLTSVTIPDGVTVGRYAFEECSSLESVVIGDEAVLLYGAFSFNKNRDNWSNVVEYVDGERYYAYKYLSPLTSLTIGENVDIGEYAFFGAAELLSVTLGNGARIGDYAFYNAASLTDISLGKVIKIGEYAFSGDIVPVYTIQDCSSGYEAYDDEGYIIYKFYTPKFTSLDLGKAESIGKEAFAYCQSLASVTLGETQVIKDGTFRNNTALTEINLGKVKYIGEAAFSECMLVEIDLSSVVEVGKYSFLQNEELTSVKLGKDIISVGEGAFSYCKKLLGVENLDKIKDIGAYAFAYTDIKSANLKNAEKIGDFAFLKQSLADFTLVLGEGLKEIGDNPFGYCRIAPFYTTETTTVNGKDYTKTLYTYRISERVRVIDGSIYYEVPNGLELILYCGRDRDVTVAEDTVRIGAMAFIGSDVTNVILPYTVEAIGHKAFYDCQELATVTFQSYYAPVLEEEFDYYYFASGESFPNSTESGGIGVVDFPMWNLATDPTNIYYGASFIDYVGRVEEKIVMIHPSNGQNYDSFIFSQYFITYIRGAAAKDDVTLNAESIINSLPEKVELKDKALVMLARESYNKVASTEQKALIEEAYAKLTSAEKRISNLEYLENESTVAPDGPEDTPSEEPKSLSPLAIVLISLGGALVLSGAAVTVVFIIKKKKQTSPSNPESSSEDTVQ